jgi:hypothetical protein
MVSHGGHIGNYMTKPNQGALFMKFRDQIMGVIPAKDPGPGKVKKDSKSLVQQGKEATSRTTGVCWTKSHLQNGSQTVRRKSLRIKKMSRECF